MNLSRHGLIRLACLTLACTVLCGCWDAEDLEHTADVSAIGIDRGTTRTLRVTFQVSIPRTLAGGGAGPSGGGVGGGGSGEAPRVWVRAMEADSVSEAFDLLGEYLPRTPVLSHLQAVVISEEVARQRGVGSLWDFLTRDAQARRTAQFIVTPGRAEEVLYLQPRLADIPGAGLVAMLELAADTGATISTPTGRFGMTVHAEGIQPVAAMVEVAPEEAQYPPDERSGGADRAGSRPGDPTTAAPGTVSPTREVHAAGLAVFRGDRMVGTLPKNESTAVSIMLRKARRPLIRAITPDSGVPVTARVLSCRPEISMMSEGGEWRGQVRLRISAELREELTPTYSIEPARLKQLERTLAAALTKDLVSTLRHTQEMGADVFGFGWCLYRKQPQQWFAVRDNWDRIYGQLPVVVGVDVKLRAEGMTVKSPLPPGTPEGNR